MGAFRPHGGPFTRAFAGAFSPMESGAYRRIAEVSRDEEAFVMHEFDDPELWQRNLAAELCDEQTLISDDGQAFGGLWLNRDARLSPSNKAQVLVVSNGFLADVTQTDVKIRAYELAKVFPDHQILMHDQPSHGLSDNYTRLQRLELARGHMGSVGHQQYSALKKFISEHIPSVKSIELRGESFGSRQGLEVVNASFNSDFPIENMVALELPGTENGRRASIHASYFTYEFLRSSYYNAPWLAEYKKRFDEFLRVHGSPDRTAQAQSFFMKDKRMAVENFWNSVLGRGTGLEVLRSLVEKGVNIVRVVGEASRIDRSEIARKQKEDLSYELGRSFGVWVARGESHDGTGTLSRARLAALITHHALMNAQQIASSDEVIEFSMRDVQNDRMPSLRNRVR